MTIFQAYETIKKGGSLSDKCCTQLIEAQDKITNSQWSSLSAFLLSRPQTQPEKSLFSWILEHKALCKKLVDINKKSSFENPPLSCFIRAIQQGTELGAALITWWIDSIVSSALSDEEIAFCLATITCNNLHENDVNHCIHAMACSGPVYDYRNLKELSFRKIIRRYPTGALSEKGALLLPALLASVSDRFPIATPFLVAKSLSFTGGTWDKLSSIPGFTFPNPGEESIRSMQGCSVAMTVTHGDANPADRILYQLRSATGTVESDPLIISSIVSKQYTFPADQLLLDVRYGQGAFLPNKQRAKTVASTIEATLCDAGIPTSYLLTDTSAPNGSSIGNALEVLETLSILRNGTVGQWREEGLREQQEMALRLFSTLLHASFPEVSLLTFYEHGRHALESGKALNSFFKILEHHRVSKKTIEGLQNHPSDVLLSGLKPIPILAQRSGSLLSIDQKRMGNLVNFILSKHQDGTQDVRSGIQLHVRLHDKVERESVLASVYSEIPKDSYYQELLQCFEIS